MYKVSGCDGLIVVIGRYCSCPVVSISVSMLLRPKLDCLLLDMSNAKRKSKSIANSPDGVAALLSWLNKQEVAIQDVQVIMEPTGVYHERALFALAQAGLAVSLVNPAQLRKFAQGIGVKTKTDAADSAVPARYGAANHPLPGSRHRRLHANSVLCLLAVMRWRKTCNGNAIGRRKRPQPSIRRSG